MNTNQYLNSLGVTMTQARSSIADNLDKPAAIFNAAKQYKIDSQMLAEIVSPLFPGTKAQDVEKFFEVNGLKGYTLNPLDIDSNTSTLLRQGAIELAPLYSFNNNTGNLSTESLRNAVIATTTALCSFKPRHDQASAKNPGPLRPGFFQSLH